MKIKMQVAVLYQVNKHPKTPRFAKILVIIALGYALSPIDLIPDFIPILGYIDDLIILPILIFCAVKLIPSDVWNECIVKAKTETTKPPKNWMAAVIIALIWILVAILLLAKLFGYL